MKRLLILRHAKAQGTEIGGTDKTRKLSAEGVSESKALGNLMVREELTPDHILCSSARRTRETLDGILEHLGSISTDYSDALYNADYNILLGAIHNAGEEVKTLLVVAHNPGVHTLAARLAEDDGSSHVDRLSMSYAPATLTVLDCDIGAWKELKAYSNPVKAIHETIDYNADDRPTRWM